MKSVFIIYLLESLNPSAVSQTFLLRQGSMWFYPIKQFKRKWHKCVEFTFNTRRCDWTI